MALGCWQSHQETTSRHDLDLLDISMDDLDEQMCWECWPEGDDVDDISAGNVSA